MTDYDSPNKRTDGLTDPKADFLELRERVEALEEAIEAIRDRLPSTKAFEVMGFKRIGNE